MIDTIFHEKYQKNIIAASPSNLPVFTGFPLTFILNFV